MKYLLLLCILLTGCAEIAATSHPAHHKRVRVTFYGGHRERTAIGGYCKEGLTVAAHPKYKFGSQLLLPALKPILGESKFTVQDRGSAVTSMKASHGRADVIDVYVSSMAKLRRLACLIPEYLDMETPD